jgi:hypothetical protein
MGWGQPKSQARNLEANQYAVEEAQSVASCLGIDNISYLLRAPVYVHKSAGKDGRLFYGDGMIRTGADLSLLELPDPHDKSLYAMAEEFARQKGDRSAWFVTRIGMFPAMLSMGIERFCVALYENRSLVEAVLDRYYDWMMVVAEHICRLGFDVFVSTDDFAFKSGPFLSPTMFRDLVIPRHQRVAQKISIPWILHSDGNLMPYLDDLMSLGITGLHPNEKGAMDIRTMKREYGDRICLLGNVDLNILGMGTPEDVEQEVRGLIRDVGPGGGYIVTSGNTLAGYLRPENVLTLGRAVHKYGRYPLRV